MGPVGGKMERVEVAVRGMRCAACQSAVREALLEAEGVAEALVDLEGGRATVVFDGEATGLPALRAAIEEAGFDVVEIAH